MYADAKKIQVIEQVLQLNNTASLIELEAVLNKWKKVAKIKTKKVNILDFVGTITPKEATQIKEAINATPEQISTDEWK